MAGRPKKAGKRVQQFKNGETPWNKDLRHVRDGTKPDQHTQPLQRINSNDLPQETTTSVNVSFGTAFKLRPKKSREQHVSEEDTRENIICGIRQLEALVNATKGHDTNCLGELHLAISSMSVHIWGERAGGVSHTRPT
jgi:hypothetical protein